MFQFVPVNDPTPAIERYILPLRSGDRLTIPVHLGTLAGKRLAAVEAALFQVGGGDTAQPVAVANLDEYAQATYTAVTLRLPVSLPSLPADDPLQVAMVRPNGQTVGGTFTTRATDAATILRELIAHYEAYPHGPVLALPLDDNAVQVRFYESNRFNYRGAESWTIGLGRRDPSALNTNRPKLTWTKQAGVNIPAADCYTVVLAGDVVAGNVLTLLDKTVTVASGDTPAAILQALGVSSGRVLVASGQGLNLTFTPGSQTLSNTDGPTFTMQYVATEGSNVRYKALLSGSLRPGNVFSLTGPGFSTLTATATDTDTLATIRAAFGGDAGLLVPAGTVLTPTMWPGTQTIPNTNTPSYFVTAKKTIAAYSVDRYTGWVDTSIRSGNRYHVAYTKSGQLVTLDYTAKTGDTVSDVAKGLGFAGVPFVIDADAATAVTIWAEPGSRIQEATHLLALSLDGPERAQPTHARLNLTVPSTLPNGDYALLLREKRTGDVLATAVARFSTSAARLSSYVHYRLQHPVDGLLWGRLRLPLRLGAEKPRVTESQYLTLDQQPRRSRVYIDAIRPLLTDPMPPAFHRDLTRVLKADSLRIDEQEVLHLGEYSTTEGMGLRLLMQGSGDVRLTRPVLATEAVELVGMAGVSAWLQTAAGDRLPLSNRYVTIPTGEYWLLLLTDEADRHMVVRQVGSLATGRLAAGELARVGPVRIGPAVAPLQLWAFTAPGTVTGSIPATDLPTYTVTDTSPETAQRGPDFSDDFNDDFL